MKAYLIIVVVVLLAMIGYSEVANGLRVESVTPPCCLEVKPLPAQPELKVVANEGLQTEQGFVLQGSNYKVQGE